MKSREITAKMENLTEVMNFIDTELLETEYSESIKNQILISAEEIFTNIATYAYPDHTDKRTEISCGIIENNGIRFFQIRFRDWGIPYNPLEHSKPDFEIPFEKRGIGGLGIHMVRHFMDQMEYHFMDGCNQLWIRKAL